MQKCYCTSATDPISIQLISINFFPKWLRKQSPFVKNWIDAQKLDLQSNNTLLLPAENGQLQQVLVVYDETQPVLERIAHLPMLLPIGIYTLLERNPNPLLILGWGMGAYAFTRYKKAKREPAQLVYPYENLETSHTLDAIYLVRDLINTPTEDMAPPHLAEVTKQLAKSHKATFSEVVGDDLLKHNFPAIHMVGRAGQHAPRLIRLQWGKTDHPKIVLIGKGVCFDTGGLNLKPSNNMRWMKKDMGGAAHVLGLASLIMAEKLPVQLEVLIPAVENAVAANAMRPGDIIKMRNGKTVEIDNTDAEGRLVLADAISFAIEQKPVFLVDIATLTGAARTAVGTDITAYFSNSSKVAEKFAKLGQKHEDPVWQLPLYQPYFADLRSSIADMKNSGSGYAGAITAALFLQKFITKDVAWLHLDIMAWNLSNRAAHPEGGEAMAIRALYEYIKL
jgi:leucyl aminopeptidase